MANLGKKEKLSSRLFPRTMNDYSENVEKSSLVWKEGDDEADDVD